MCGLGISLHIYLKDILCTLLHVCLQDIRPDNVHTHLAETYVYLDIYVKQVHTGHSVY